LVVMFGLPFMAGYLVGRARRRGQNGESP
jgi:hypothetical protein